MKYITNNDHHYQTLFSLLFLDILNLGILELAQFAINYY